MHKFILKTFGFFKSCLQFLQILALFCVLMLLLYWIQNLLGEAWEWLGFIKPLLDFFIALGSLLADGSVKLFAAVFEYKYFMAVVILCCIYFLAHFGIRFLSFFEEVYGDGRRAFKKLEEDLLNKSLEKQIVSEQKSLKRFQVYVSADVKEKWGGASINLDEQLKFMNKFVIDKTSVSPVKWEDGFLYTFENFARIDDSLDVFFKLLKSSAPLDYVICVQVFGENSDREMNQLKQLVSLKIVNKITMFPDTVLRYRYNTTHRYGTSQLGLFQKSSGTFEVHEFQEM